MDNRVSKSYEVLQSKLGWLQAQFKKLAKRATKVGCPAPILTVGESFTQKIENGENECRVVAKVNVTITGETPKFNGWIFAAALSHLEGGETVIRNIAAQEAPEKYRTSGPVCEHCKVNRRRNDTYLVVNEKEWKQVGSTCIDDFLGGKDLGVLACQADLLAEAFGLGEDTEGMGGGGSDGYSLTPFMVAVVELCRQKGFMGRGKAREEGKEATADLALALLKSCKLEKSENDANRAEMAIDWARDLPDENLTEFLHNIRAIARAGYVDGRTAGYGAAIFVGWERAQADEADKVSTHQGVPGTKVERQVMLRSVRGIETMYGTSYLHIFVDDAHNIYKWFASKDSEMEAGKNYTIVGKVKAHDEFKGVKQTSLTRVKAK